MRYAEDREIDASFAPTSAPSQPDGAREISGRRLPKFNNIPPTHPAGQERSDVIPGRGDLRISLTSACNLKCDYCHNEGQRAPWHRGRKAAVTPEAIEGLLDVAARYGVRSVKFSGGDPGVFPGIAGVLDAVADWRERYPGIAKWGLATNGAPFLNPAKFEALATSDLDNISIGIDSVEPDELSKPSSPVGISGTRVIDEFVLPLRARWTDRAIKFDTVFTGDQRRTLNVIRAARVLGINISVIEINGVMETVHFVREKFLELITETAEEFQLEPRLYQPLNEIYLYDGGGNTPIKFYQDHCRDLDCGHCRKIHLRVSSTADGWSSVPCFLRAQAKTIPLTTDGSLEASRFEDALEYAGRGPQWFNDTPYARRR
jgi:molybdenum cofactor biosynthesis enzyme MoaA